MTEYFSLFHTDISKAYIDPTLWNKGRLIKDIEYNYNLDPTRNVWNDSSNLHHYFNDWQNPQFRDLDLSNLNPLYNKIISDHMNNIKLKDNKILNWKWNIVNITAYSHKQFMHTHDHFLGQTIFTAVHYVSVPNSHSYLNFLNPLVIAQYHHPLLETINSLLDNQYSKNSVYFSDWDQKLEEDTILIFPSFLKHQVKEAPKQNQEEKLRIGIVLNIEIDNYE